MASIQRTKALIWFWRIHPWLYQISGGRIGAKLLGYPVLLLQTIGRRSGQERTHALYYFPHEDRYVVIASNAGYAKHPGWYFNLNANPQATIQVGPKRMRVMARVAEGDERAALWDMMNDAYNGMYAEYNAQVEREIPVVVLEPID